MDAFEGEPNSEIRDAILLGDRGASGVKVRANPAKISEHALGCMGLETGHSLGRVGLVIEHHEFQGKPSVSYLNSPSDIDALNGNFVAMFQVVSDRRVAAGQWDHSAHLDGLRKDIDRTKE